MALASFSILIKCLRFCGEQTLGCVISSGAGCCLHKSPLPSSSWSLELCNCAKQPPVGTSQQSAAVVASFRSRSPPPRHLFWPPPTWYLSQFRTDFCLLSQSEDTRVKGQNLSSTAENKSLWCCQSTDFPTKSQQRVLTTCLKERLWHFGRCFLLLLKISQNIFIRGSDQSKALFFHNFFAPTLHITTWGLSTFPLLQTPTFLCGEEDLVRSQPCFSTL